MENLQFDTERFNKVEAIFKLSTKLKLTNDEMFEAIRLIINKPNLNNLQNLKDNEILEVLTVLANNLYKK